MSSTTVRLNWRLQITTAAFVAALFGPVPARSLAATPPDASDHSATGTSSETDAEVDDVESASGFRGVDLGNFSVRNYRAGPAQRQRVAFTLHAAVRNENFKQFEQLFEHRKNKVRDQVIVAIRLVPTEDYDDPELKKLRRRILLRLRRTLPELKFDDLFVSDFDLSVESL
jgi:hypothetical protein